MEYPLDNLIETVSIPVNDLREILQGKVQIQECGACLGVGYQWELDYTLKESPHIENQRLVSEHFALGFFLEDYPDYASGDVYRISCPDCNGLGIIAKGEEGWGRIGCVSLASKDFSHTI